MKKPGKAAAPFVPVPAGTQRRKHQRQLARMAHWKPLTFSQQRQQHRAAAAASAAHHVKKAKKPKKPMKARGWSPDESVALCSARAVAESLRLALGVPVSHDDVLVLYWLVADDPDTGASILATLEASREFGIDGFRPQILHDFAEDGHDRRRVGFPVLGEREPFGRLFDLEQAAARAQHEASLILGVDWPEPHAVVAHDGFWWSWGQPYEPWTDQVSEAWAVTW